MLQTPQPPTTEAMLTALVNDITNVSDNFIFVLDDYHLIDAEAIDDVLVFFTSRKNLFDYFLNFPYSCVSKERITFV